VVYFEKQGTDMMCGLHAINALMQGPVFDEVTLGFYAQKLDEKERALLGGELGTDKSQNVAMDGNYSI